MLSNTLSDDFYASSPSSDERQHIKPTLTRDEAMILVEDMYLDFVRFCRTLFGHRFHKEFSTIHLRIIYLLMAKDENGKYLYNKLCIIAPRGLGKTALLFGFICYEILFRETSHIMLVSDTAMHAIGVTNQVKYELTSNGLIKELFPGDIKPTDNSDGLSFSEKQWTTGTGITVTPKGAGQQIRGSNSPKGERPSLLVIDDLEDPDEAENQVNREKLLRWFDSSLLPAISDSSSDSTLSDTRVIAIGTIVHQESLLSVLAETPGWHVERFRMFELGDKGQIVSNWEEQKSSASLQAIYDALSSHGNSDLFWREYANVIIPREGKKFPKSLFKYYNEADREFTQHAINIMIVDPNKAKPVAGKKRDNAVAIVIGLDRVNMRWLIRDVYSAKVAPSDFWRIVVDNCKAWQCRLIGVEKTGLEDYVMYPIQSALQEARLENAIEVYAFGTSGVSKEDRICQLQPFYKQGLIYHNPTCCQLIETEFDAFPVGKTDDAIDAVAHTLKVLEEYSFYFPVGTGSSQDILVSTGSRNLTDERRCYELELQCKLLDGTITKDEYTAEMNILNPVDAIAI
jgi:hypothetical protein